MLSFCLSNALSGSQLQESERLTEGNYRAHAVFAGSLKLMNEKFGSVSVDVGH